uniref:AP complex subunit beta n=1 Tax=Neobodo designis TaxID=312471 RepID=A0A7S1L067_NEODS|mmetsp:Transcript_12094/g.37630  ORF Transcript_12094/g.37630 Transcript_12094/m.37630 type:complete len:933 (+) Transcript_12094:29-2827(+)|eukprot:CAMPEP_0174850648 /NCGR_PEP_ID=MMETSP1114-20130205/20541_1 /TAXON_ID=312471 /ORGANISM="Neobodo designis, Strain CCAP 1951/1" /LENGTH=932 /DNA_ID=CAMNT_0016085121 /DNA_START=29 /DNA_END=2827 /DNA_ORIENTATION=+
MWSALSLDATFKKVANQLKRAGGGARFFNAQGKRGESVELHQDLNSNDRERQKNALKRIIANMTLGRDVSQLFADVVKLGQTPNLEVKKLVYLYVLSNAKLQPDKALMAVNTFLQDATHQSPIVRALALRTMLCLRVDAVLEYTIPPLVAALTTVGEADAYVRKTAAIGVGKVYHQSPLLFDQHGLLQHLTNLLSDTFPIVASNAAAVLSEIVTTPNFSSFDMQKAWVHQLLNCLADCTEWGQVYVLEAVALYRAPADEVENLTERVLPRLQHSNSAVVLAAVKAIATFAQRMPPAARGSYITRINAALLTLAKAGPETQFIVCRNAHMLLSVFPDLLADNFDSFFIRFSDPAYVKFEKLRLLLRLVSPTSAAKVVKELAEYSNEVDPVFVAEVVRATAVVAIKVESTAERCAELIKEIATRRRDTLATATVAAKDVLRRYPNLVIDLLPPLLELGADTVQEEDARCALVWMLGEFSDVIENGSDLVAELSTTFSEHELPVQRALLTTVVKQFLTNPSAHEKDLTRVLDAAMRGSSNPDLRDRALFYYRLLSRGIGVAKMSAIVRKRQVPADVDRSYAEGMTNGEILRSLNTVAAVYAKPPRKFLPAYGLRGVAVVEDDDEVEEPATPSSEAGAPAPAPQGQQPPEAAASASEVQRHSDPMDTIFGQGDAQPRGASTVASSDPFDAMFGEKGGGNSGSRTVALPPEVVSAAANHGVSVHAEFVPCANGPGSVALSVGFSNGSNSAITSIQLQLNRNRFSFAPAEALQVPTPMAPGSEWSGIVPLIPTAGHASSTQGTAVQCGVSINGKVVTFTVDVPNHLVFDFAPSMEKNEFARHWQSMDSGAERLIYIGLVADMERLLPQKRIAVIANVGGDRLFATAKLHTGVTALCEVVLSSGQVTVRCADASAAVDLFERALPPRGKVKTTVDDLFA